MDIGFARTDHPEVHEIVPSDHCLLRFRQRRPIRHAGADPVVSELLAVLEAADISAWPPGWAVSDQVAAMWAVSGDVAFPLVGTPSPGRWLAVTCLRR